MGRIDIAADRSGALAAQPSQCAKSNLVVASLTFVPRLSSGRAVPFTFR